MGWDVNTLHPSFVAGIDRQRCLDLLTGSPLLPITRLVLAFNDPTPDVIWIVVFAHQSYFVALAVVFRTDDNVRCPTVGTSDYLNGSGFEGAA